MQVSWHSLYWGVCSDRQLCCWSPLGQVHRCYQCTPHVIFMLHMHSVGEGCRLSQPPQVTGRGRQGSLKAGESLTEHRCDQVKCLCFSFPKGKTCLAYIVAVGRIPTLVQTCLSHKSILLLAFWFPSDKLCSFFPQTGCEQMAGL